MSLPLAFAFGVLMLRLGILAAGTLFCWFGYRLFAGTSHASGVAEISVKDYFTLNLYKVGPGVFFSAFGAAILIYSISKPATLELRESVLAGLDNAATEARGGKNSQDMCGSLVIGGLRDASAGITDKATLLRISNQVAFMNRLAAAGDVAPEDRKDVDRMTKQIRLSLMKSVWRPEWGDAAEFELWTRDPSGKKPNEAAKTFYEMK